MDDFSALALRVALGVGDVPGCLILSREGLVLGSYPEGDNGRVKQAWLRFATLGSAEKGFIELADQIWVYAHRGPYAAFAIAEISVRPGLLLDMLEQALLEAEESRTRREGLRHPEGAAQAPVGKLRTAMHPSPDRPQIVAESAATVAAAEAAPGRARKGTSEADREDAGEPQPAPEPETNAPSDVPEPAPTGRKEPAEDEAEVDRVMLAQEFSGLLQAGDPDDEG
jgi:hypothetical protein